MRGINNMTRCEMEAEIESLRDQLNEASDKALLYAGKYSDLVQAITDPENQPSQYGTVLLDAQAPTIPEGYQLIRSDLVAFLDGSGELDGWAFGDVDSSKQRPRYWWRALLKDAPKPKEKP